MFCLFHVFTNYLMEIYLYSITTEFNPTRLKVDANVTTGRKVEHKMTLKHLVGSREQGPQVKTTACLIIL